MYLGIDVGGTHTDAVLYHKGHVHAVAKVKTQAQALPTSIKNVLQALQKEAQPKHWQNIARVTLGTTLGLNALVQNSLEPVGLFLTAGPGMDPLRFVEGLGDFVHRVPGGLDHRGQEVTPLQVENIAPIAKAWVQAGVRHFAVAGKFSVHNPMHEQAIATELCKVHGIEAHAITLSHTLSGALNFPRRMSAAYANAAIQKIQRNFLHAVQQTVAEFSLTAPIYLLKADGGALAWDYVYAHPLYSVLSGPAASVMGGMVLQKQYEQEKQDAILLDIGGTTTDIAVYVQGIPVLDREGMRLPIQGHVRTTPLRSLATHSLGLGGDSLITLQQNVESLHIGPQRLGDAAAFGGTQATFLDALNVCALQEGLEELVAGDGCASQKALENLVSTTKYSAQHMAHMVVEKACAMVLEGLQKLLLNLAGQPVYTLAELLEEYTIKPDTVIMVGAPAKLFSTWLGPYLQAKAGMVWHVPPYSPLANALGAAATLPTAQLEFFADTLQGVWHIPTLHLQGKLDKTFTLDKGIALATQALREHFPRTSQGEKAQEQAIDVINAQSFATLDAHGRGGRDVRVGCQWRPGIT